MSVMLELRKYHEVIDWNVGTMFLHTDAFFNFMERMREESIDTGIKYSFGSFTCRWNSGRIVLKSYDRIETFRSLIDIYNSFGVSTRFTFSNHLLTEKDLEDEMCNRILEYLGSKNKKDPSLENGVILVSDMLKNYIRKNYPNIKLTASLYKSGIETGFITNDSDYYNKLLDEFDVVVIDNNKVKDKDFAFLNSLKDKNRIEIIANNTCMRHCPNVKRHDNLVAQTQLAMCENDEKKRQELQNQVDELLKYCHTEYLKDSNNNLRMSIEDINECIDLGFKHYKLQGRECQEDEFFRDVFYYIFENM